MGRSNRDIYSPQGPPRSSIAYHAASQYNSDSSDLESPVYGPPDGNGNSSRFRYQDDGNTLYAAVAAQYQYPTSIYVAQGVATRQDDLRIQDAQVPSPTSATSGSEHGGELAGSHPSFGRNHVFFAMDPPDQSGSRLPMPLSNPTRMDASEPFADYSTYDSSYRANMPVGGTRTNNSSSSPLVDTTSRRGTSREISTVVIACRPCRGRKIRCDSNRPSCNNCVRRKNECIYDTAPKRRGPDKRPGTRQRSCKKRPTDGSSPPPLKRKRKAASSSTTGVDVDPSTTGSISGSGESSTAMKESQKPTTPVRKRSSGSSASASYSQPRPIQPHPLPSASASAPLRITTDLYRYSQPSPQSRSAHSDASSGYQPFTSSPYVTVKQQPHSPFLQPASAVPPDATHRKFPVPSTPAVESNQRTWWTLFLEQYPLNDVVADLSYLFSDTGHWLCFLNLTFFLDMLWNPEERLKIQPSFILAGLAMAELMRAQNALAIAMSGGNGDWIDASLAEAALILVLYESSAHPQYHPDRVAGALRVLDQILKTISVSTIDIMDQDVATFKNNSVPIVNVPYRPHHYERKCTCMPPGSPPPDTTQTWALPLRWDPTWTAIQVRNEECRRLSWSALSLATSYLIQCVAFDREMPVLELSNPANYAILFPGEVIDRVSHAYCSPNSPSPKESVWALYCRSLLLWNFCNRLLSQPGPKGPHQIDAEAEALQESWNEAQAIQDSLEMHICNYETGVTYLCQEYIHNTRMSVTQALRKMQGLSREISTTPGPLFNRKQACQWIDYQARVIKRVKLATYQLGGPQGYQLTRRPFQVHWFLNQLSVCMQIWTHDTALSDAVELAKDFVAVVDVLNALWPSKSNQIQSDDLRKQLTQACAIVGTEAPLPPTYATSLIRV
ncbi:Zn(2)-C6 fungal-type domain-containing protein [Mycena venus]|uniref:Zn(2)-C6 fungal-type domain-containing protein n=1 Tax=Mycena venus TaxID=2733690 RepID=A0A8H6Y0R9_9AGAR|nr:Zn(2)-C6 fungal-type domain-containing protein [Mycena venus]